MAEGGGRDRLRGRELLLGETSSLCAFAQVGHAHTLLGWFGDALWTVREVYDELIRNRGRFAAAERLIRHLEEREHVVDLSPEGVAWGAPVAPFFPRPSRHRRENAARPAPPRPAGA